MAEASVERQTNPRTVSGVVVSDRMNKTITVRTNDPDSPTTVLRFKVEVEKDPFHMNNLGPAANRK